MRYICIDIGTTTLKGIVYDEYARIKATAERNPKLYSEATGRMEHDPEEVIWHLRSVLKELISKIYVEREKPAFIAFSAYMHSLIAIGENDEFLSNCLLWNDSRSKKYADKAFADGVAYDLYGRTGTPIHPMSPLFKIIYFREEEPEVFEKAKLFVSMKDIAMKWICGEYLVDYSCASATGLFNLQNLEWDPKALEYAGITSDRLSKPIGTDCLITRLSQQFKDEVGLKEDCPIVPGASDGCLANLGSRGLIPGTAVCTIGTSAAIRVVNSKPMIDDEARTFSYYLDKDLYVSGGALNNGGIAYEWLRKNLSYTEHFDEAMADINLLEEARGLIFLPFLSGERAPYWDADLRAAYLGLRHEHDTDDLFLAGVEGICYAIKDVFEVLLATEKEQINESNDSKGVDVIYANGGFTNSNLWLQLLADILERKVVVSDQGDGALFGAFLLGMKAIGEIKDLEEAERFFTAGREFLPRQTDRHKKRFDVYKKAVKANRELLHELAEI